MNKPTLYITTWRTPFDDDDTLDTRIAHSAPNVRAMRKEVDPEYDPEALSGDDYHPFELAHAEITDGAVFEDEDGNKWTVSFTARSDGEPREDADAWSGGFADNH
jgi:hypothetical protein